MQRFTFYMTIGPYGWCFLSWTMVCYILSDQKLVMLQHNLQYYNKRCCHLHEFMGRLINKKLNIYWHMRIHGADKGITMKLSYVIPTTPHLYSFYTMNNWISVLWFLSKFPGTQLSCFHAFPVPTFSASGVYLLYLLQSSQDLPEWFIRVYWIYWIYWIYFEFIAFIEFLEFIAVILNILVNFGNVCLLKFRGKTFACTKFAFSVWKDLLSDFLFVEITIWNIMEINRGWWKYCDLIF